MPVYFPCWYPNGAANPKHAEEIQASVVSVFHLSGVFGMTSLQWSDINLSPAASTSMTLFLYWMQCVIETFQSSTPPLRLIFIEDVSEADKQLREMNPLCSLSGPHDIYVVVLFDAPSALAFSRHWQVIMTTASEQGDVRGQKRSASAADDVHLAPTLTYKTITDPVHLLTRMRQHLGNSKIDIGDLTADVLNLDSRMAMVNSAHPLVSLQPDRVMDRSLWKLYFEITASSTKWKPADRVKKWNNTFCISTVAEMHSLFGTEGGSVRSDAILKRCLPWLRPSVEEIATKVKEQCYVSNIEVEKASNDVLVSLIDGMFVKDEGKRPSRTITDPFSVQPVHFKIASGARQQDLLGRAISKKMPGLSLLYNNNNRAFAAVAGFRQQNCFMKKLYEQMLRLLESSSSGQSGVQIPPNLVEHHQSSKVFFAGLKSKPDWFQKDFKNFVSYDVSTSQYFLARWIKRLTNASGKLGLISTQISTFLLCLTHAWGVVLNSSPSLLNVVLVGPPGTGKSKLLQEFLKNSGLPSTTQVHMSNQAMNYADWLLDCGINASDESAMFSGGLPPALFAAYKTIFQEGATTSSVVQKDANGNLGLQEFTTLARAFFVFCANFRLVKAAGDSASEETFGALHNRLTYRNIPKCSERDKQAGITEMSKAATSAKSDKLIRLLNYCFRFYGLCSEIPHLLTHALSLQNWDHQLSELFLISTKSVLPEMDTRSQERWRQQAEALTTCAIIAELMSGSWRGPGGRPISDPDKALICARLRVVSPESLVLAFWFVVGDISSVGWKRHAADCIFGGALLRTSESEEVIDSDSNVCARATTFRCGSSRDALMTVCPSLFKLAAVVVEYLNAQPNTVNPGVDMVVDWLGSLGYDDRQMLKVSQATFYGEVNRKMNGEVTSVVLSRKVVSNHLTPVQVTILREAYDLWNAQKDHEKRYADGSDFGVLELTTLVPGDDESVQEQINNLTDFDAAVIDNPYLFLGGKVPKKWHDRALALLSGKDGTRIGQRNYDRLLAALSALKENPADGKPYLKIKSTQTAYYTELADSEFASETNGAKKHPTKPGRYIVKNYCSSSLIINVAAIGQLSEDTEGAGDVLDRDMVRCLSRFYDVTGTAPGKKPERYPIAVSATAPVRLIDFTPIEPSQSMTVSDPRFKAYAAGAEFTDEWDAIGFNEEEALRDDVRSRIFPGKTPKVTLQPGSNIYAELIIERLELPDSGCWYMVPPSMRPYVEAEFDYDIDWEAGDVQTEAGPSPGDEFFSQDDDFSAGGKGDHPVTQDSMAVSEDNLEEYGSGYESVGQSSVDSGPRNFFADDMAAASGDDADTVASEPQHAAQKRRRLNRGDDSDSE